MNKKIYIAIPVLIIVFTAGYFLSKIKTGGNGLDGNPVILSPAKNLKNFSFLDENNKSFTKARLTGKWSLIFFGYTSCPDVCPTTLHTLTEAYNELVEDKADIIPQIILISVDPDRDKYKGNPNKLKNYISYFHKDFIAASGDHNQLKLFTQQLGASYEIKKSAGTKNFDKNNYDVAHTPLIFIINPKGDLSGFIKPPHTAKLIVNAIDDLP